MNWDGVNSQNEEEMPDSVCYSRPYTDKSPFQSTVSATLFARLDTPTSQHSLTYLAEPILINIPSFQELWSTGTLFRFQLASNLRSNLLAEHCIIRSGRRLSRLISGHDTPAVTDTCPWPDIQRRNEETSE